ncbi:hypothetical protein P153DRAFT_217879 [Dothidotthia symphoricarpi CBS 119687]|uniref:Uncharacterized protein n=1 Tax=Dothidotthia symphoricarpi CBS 119687 TaxID=1392245 RepID=A0A6A6AEW6_9PLEO|nr:uncharacterized protein P153DRAFT_217879 [Dothidotthia symphoricarpi CBS 119687]KAF2130439.1 hypothetical protein P153DRAFT_217879 [Dothidotthia symphoricarpi CBS 119687]
MARRRAHSPPEGEPAARSRTKPSISDSDARSTESQQMLALPPLLKKPRKENNETQQFRIRTAKDQKDLRALMQRKMLRAKEADEQRRNELTATLLSALQTPSRPARHVTTFPNTSIAENGTFASAAAVLIASDKLVREYERVHKVIVQLAGEQEGNDPVADVWRKEVKDLERVLRAGARKAGKDVGKVLGGVQDGGEADDEDEEMNGAGAMQDGEMNMELKKSLEYMERGVRRMVKGLPRDEE